MLHVIARFGIAILLLGAAAVPATAASPHQLDPAQMTPPLNPDFGPWICTDTGQGAVCRGHNQDSWSIEDTGLVCGASTIYTTGWFDTQAVRWHLPDGRAIHTFFKNSSSETWSLSPSGGGQTVQVKGSFNQHYVYPVPGDINQRVETITGADWQVTAKGTGLVFHDTGVLRRNPGVDTGTNFTHGPTDSDHGNLDLVIDDICAALGG
jgi:hypothetical protein